MRRDRQVVTVQVTLIGVQDISVAAVQPRTECAAIGMRIGGSLLYLNDAATLARFARTWYAMQTDAGRLPREAPVSQRRATGAGDPTVVASAGGDAPSAGTVVRRPGQPNRLLISLGKLVYDVRDLLAFQHVSVAFRRAESIAHHTFPIPRDAAPHHAAARIVSQALAAGTAPARRNGAGPAPPTWPSRPAQPVRADREGPRP